MVNATTCAGHDSQPRFQLCERLTPIEYIQRVRWLLRELIGLAKCSTPEGCVFSAPGFQAHDVIVFWSMRCAEHVLGTTAKTIVGAMILERGQSPRLRRTGQPAKPSARRPGVSASPTLACAKGRPPPLKPPSAAPPSRHSASPPAGTRVPATAPRSAAGRNACGTCRPAIARSRRSRRPCIR